MVCNLGRDELGGRDIQKRRRLGDGGLGRTAVRVNELLIRLSRTLFSYQIFVVAQCRPGVRFVLDDSQSRSAPVLPG